MGIEVRIQGNQCGEGFSFHNSYAFTFKKYLKISFKSWIIKMGGNFPLGSLKGKKKF